MSDNANAVTPAAPAAPEPALDGDGVLNAMRNQAIDEAAQTEPPVDLPPATRPPNVPENFWDAEKGEVRTDSLIKSWQDTRQAYLAMKGKAEATGDSVPEAADKYIEPEQLQDGVLKLPDELSMWGELRSDDPAITALTEACHQAGIGKKQFDQLFPKLLSSLGKTLPQPVDIQKELTDLGGGNLEEGKRIASTVSAWVNNLQSHGQFSDTDVAILDGLGSTKEGIRTLAKLMSFTFSQRVELPMDTSSDSNISPDEWGKMVQDDRWGVDPAYTERVNRIGRKLYPETKKTGLP